MDKKSTMTAIIAVIAIAVIGITVVYDGIERTDAETNEPVEGNFLIMDQYGVYQLVTATGTNATEALEAADDAGLIDVVIKKSAGKNLLKSVNGLTETSNPKQCWTVYTYGGSQWTYTNAGLDDITLDHDAVGLFYVEYSSSPDQPTTGGPANLESFIPQLDNSRWTGSSEGVLFELVSGSGFTTHINGTYGTDQTVRDAFEKAVADYQIPNDLSSTGIRTLFGLWPQDPYGHELDDDFGNMIAWEYNPFWMQFVWDSEKEQWDMAQKVMSLLPAAENPNMRIKINAYYAPMPSYLVTLDYDADVAGVSIMMDGKSISPEQFMGVTGCGISVTQHTLQNDMITFYYIPMKDGTGGDEFHTCTATIAPKNGPVLFASDQQGTPLENGTQIDDDTVIYIVPKSIEEIPFEIPNDAQAVAKAFPLLFNDSNPESIWYATSGATQTSATISHLYNTTHGTKTKTVAVTIEDDIESAYGAAYYSVYEHIGEHYMGTDLELFEMDLPDGINMMAVHGQGSKSAFLRVAIAVGDTLIFSGSGADDVCYFAGSDTAQLAKDMIGSLIMSALFAEKIPGTAAISAADIATKFVEDFKDTSGTTDSEWSVVGGGTLNEAKVKHTYKDAGDQPKTEYVEILKVESAATEFAGFAVEVGNYVGTSSSLGTWTQLPTDIDGVICLAANVQGSNASMTKFAMIAGGFCVMTYTEEGEGSCYFQGADTSVIVDTLLRTLASSVSKPFGTASVTVAANGDGTVSDQGTYTFDIGTFVSKCGNVLAIGDKMFTATPKESTPETKYAFDKWSAGTTDLPDVITGTVTIYANFSTTTIPTVTVTSGSNGTVAGADTKTVDYGAEITVDGVNLTIGKWKCTAIPDKETSAAVFAFQYWLFDDSTEIPETVTKDMTIKGIFSATVTPSEDDKGNVNIDASEMGDSVIVAAIPADAKTVNIKAKDYAISVPDASALEGKTVTTSIQAIENPSTITGNAYEFEFKCDDAAFTGTMKVTLPCIKAAGKNVVVYFVDGTKSEAMKTTENDDGTVTFETTHNSVYVVSYEDIPPVPPVPPTPPAKTNGNLILYVAIAIIAILAVAGGVYFYMQKKKSA